MPEHVLVAEKEIGRPVKGNEVVHHINEVKADNRPENLYLFENISKHTRYHNLIASGKTTPILNSNLPMMKKVINHANLI